MIINEQSKVDAARITAWQDELETLQKACEAGGGAVGTGSADLYYLHTDHLGKPQFATDAAGAVVWDAGTATPFGDGVQLASAFTQRLQFPGQYYDEETTLSHNHHRTYDPTLGRYLQSDPIGLAGGINRYAYVGGNPMGAVDPLGLKWVIVGKKPKDYSFLEKVAFIHFNRNFYNEAPCFLEQAKKDNFTREKKDYFHTWGIGAGGNTKWLSGKHEGIYGVDGVRRDDALGGATYNYGGSGFFSHTAYDVLPYYWLGNTPDDPTNIAQRLLRTANLPVYNGPVPPSDSCACDEPLTLRGSYRF